MPTEQEEVRTSKYNTGLAIIYRLDALWKDANRHSRQGMYSLWNLDLDNLWRELARDIDDSDYKERKAEFDGFDTQLIATGKFMDTPPSGWEGLSKEAIENREKQYKILTEKELFLKRLENHLGKGTAWSEGDEDDIE